MDEFEDFTREVAACIIQHYWREALTARRDAASLPPASKGQHKDGGAKTTKVREAKRSASHLECRTALSETLSTRR